MMQEFLQQLLQSENKPDVSHLPTLVTIRKKYPYCSFIHILEAIHAAHADKGLYQEMLRKAAVFSYSRSHLRQLLKGKPVNTSNNDIKVAELNLDEVSPIVPSQVKEEISQPFTFILTEPLVVPEPEVTFPLKSEPAAESVQEVAKPAPQYIQLDLIDKFIDTEPRIKPRREASESGVNKDLTAGIGQWDEEIVSETLAIVLLKQKKFHKAIDMYEKLKLKFPEKTAYFAALIENIRKLIDSKTENS